eukprot:432845-Pyramimonas_sp.AAC.1
MATTGVATATTGVAAATTGVATATTGHSPLTELSGCISMMLRMGRAAFGSTSICARVRIVRKAKLLSLPLTPSASSSYAARMRSRSSFLNSHS